MFVITISCFVDGESNDCSGITSCTAAVEWHTLAIWLILSQCLHVTLRKRHVLLKCAPAQLAHGLEAGG